MGRAKRGVWSGEFTRVTSDDADRPQKRFPSGFAPLAPVALLRTLQMITDIRRGARRASEASDAETRLSDSI